MQHADWRSIPSAATGGNSQSFQIIRFAATMAGFRFEGLCLAVGLLALVSHASASSELELDHNNAYNANNTSLIIDTYTTRMSKVTVTNNTSGGDKAGVTRFKTNSTTILGGERDLGVFYEQYGGATQGSSFSIEDGRFLVATGEPCSATVTLQWDGEDGSMDLQADGLGSVDLTDNGTASSFSFQYSAETGGDASVYVYSGSADDFCVYETTLVEGTDFSTASFAFASFRSVSAGCSFDNVGAVELDIFLEYGSTHAAYFYPLIVS